MFNYTSFRFLSIVAAVLLGAWPKGEKKKKRYNLINFHKAGKRKYDVYCDSTQYVAMTG